jgi:hypothetical protein
MRTKRTRPVRSADPSLSPEANELLTRELREALDGPRVQSGAVSPEPQRPHAEIHAGGGVGAALSANRLMLGLIGAVLLVTGVFATIATGSIWALIAALGVHAVVTVTVVLWFLRTTMVVEHMTPERAAVLEAEGVADPDLLLTALAEDYRGDEQRRRTEVTPSSAPTQPDPGDDFVGWGLLLTALVASLVIPFVVGGGGIWLLPAIVVPLCAAWAVGQLVTRRRSHAQLQEARRGAPAGESALSIATLAVLTGVAVVTFMVIVSFAFDGI